MRVIRVLPSAQEDIDSAASYYSSEANHEVADRFHVAVESALERLSRHPGIGVQVFALDPGLMGLRSWPIPSFERHQLFYVEADHSVEVLRVLHSAQDLVSILAEVPQGH